MSAVLHRLVLLAGCASVVTGCGLLDEPDAPPRPEPPPTVPDVGAPETDALPPAPLARSEDRMRFPGKSGEHMGFDLAKLSQLYALAGAPEIPEWSEPGQGAPRLVRDDDLRTAWQCEPVSGDEASACAIGIHFPEPADVEIVRLHAALPEAAKGRAKRGRAAERPRGTRPRRVRVHTADGWADARLSDEQGLWHVLLGEPVTTRNLTLEIMEVHGEGPVRIAELEVFGRTGVARPPLEIDHARLAVTFEAPVWQHVSKKHEAGPAFIEQIDVDGRPRRLMPGTALAGRQGDRLRLVERASWTSCDAQQGTYDMLDTRTRVVAPLGDMGEFGAAIFRHREGLGFAVGRTEGYGADVHALVLDHGKYERRTTSRLERRSPSALLEDWGIDPVPISRTEAHDVYGDDLPPGCGPAIQADLDALEGTVPRKKVAATRWLACDLGGEARMLTGTLGACGKQWFLITIDGEGTVLSAHDDQERGTHLRLRRVDEDSMLVEAWGHDDAPWLLLADSGGAKEVASPAGLSLRPPQGCREVCTTSFADLRVGPQ